VNKIRMRRPHKIHLLEDEISREPQKLPGISHGHIAVFRIGR